LDRHADPRPPAQIGGSRAAPAASDRHEARLASQSVNVLISLPILFAFP